MSLAVSSVALRAAAPPSGAQSISHPAATSAAPTATGNAITQTTAIARAGAPARSSGSRHLSTGAIALLAIALVLLVAAAAWAFARARAYEPRWLLSLRHAMAEAGYRMSATWAEFLDWARLGR